MLMTSMNFNLGEEIEALREMAHRFAQRIQRPIEFFPVVNQSQVAEWLDAGDLDIVMSSQPISSASPHPNLETCRPMHSATVAA